MKRDRNKQGKPKAEFSAEQWNSPPTEANAPEMSCNTKLTTPSVQVPNKRSRLQRPLTVNSPGSTLAQYRLVFYDAYMKKRRHWVQRMTGNRSRFLVTEFK